jgi:hypothetical protein
MFPYKIVNMNENLVVPKKDFPFYREIKRLIAEKPEYQAGIEKGVVHLAFDPGWREAMRKEAAHETTP